MSQPETPLVAGVDLRAVDEVEDDECGDTVTYQPACSKSPTRVVGAAAQSRTHAIRVVLMARYCPFHDRRVIVVGGGHVKVSRHRRWVTEVCA